MSKSLPENVTPVPPVVLQKLLVGFVKRKIAATKQKRLLFPLKPHQPNRLQVKRRLHHPTPPKSPPDVEKQKRKKRKPVVPNAPPLRPKPLFPVARPNRLLHHPVGRQLLKTPHRPPMPPVPLLKQPVVGRRPLQRRRTPRLPQHLVHNVHLRLKKPPQPGHQLLHLNRHVHVTPVRRHVPLRQTFHKHPPPPVKARQLLKNKVTKPPPKLQPRGLTRLNRPPVVPNAPVKPPPQPLQRHKRGPDVHPPPLKRRKPAPLPKRAR